MNCLHTADAVRRYFKVNGIVEYERIRNSRRNTVKADGADVRDDLGQWSTLDDRKRVERSIHTVGDVAASGVGRQCDLNVVALTQQDEEVEVASPPFPPPKKDAASWARCGRMIGCPANSIPVALSRARADTAEAMRLAHTASRAARYSRDLSFSANPFQLQEIQQDLRGEEVRLRNSDPLPEGIIRQPAARQHTNNSSSAMMLYPLWPRAIDQFPAEGITRSISSSSQRASGRQCCCMPLPRDRRRCGLRQRASLRLPWPGNPAEYLMGRLLRRCLMTLNVPSTP
jgi:hypothetical protein